MEKNAPNPKSWVGKRRYQQRYGESRFTIFDRNRNFGCIAGTEFQPKIEPVIETFGTVVSS